MVCHRPSSRPAPDTCGGWGLPGGQPMELQIVVGRSHGWGAMPHPSSAPVRGGGVHMFFSVVKSEGSQHRIVPVILPSFFSRSSCVVLGGVFLLLACFPCSPLLSWLRQFNRFLCAMFLLAKCNILHGAPTVQTCGWSTPSVSRLCCEAALRLFDAVGSLAWIVRVIPDGRRPPCWPRPGHPCVPCITTNQTLPASAARGSTASA